MYQKKHIFAAFKQSIGHPTSDFHAGIFFARKYAAYNPVASLNGMLKPDRCLNNGKCTPFFYLYTRSKLIKMTNSMIAPGSAMPELNGFYKPETVTLDCGLTKHFRRAIYCLNLKNHPVTSYIRQCGKDVSFVAQFSDNTHDFELVLRGKYRGKELRIEN